MTWDPNCYERFKDERAAPFEDLFALIEPHAGMRVIDLGCGTGELTAQLAERLPDSEVLGIDSSAEMLARAAPLQHERLRFELRRIEDVDGSYDLVFSHAALQWVEGHASVLPSVFALVAPGGQLAVQVPSNHTHATHLLMAETARDAEFALDFEGWTRASPVLSIEGYARLLYECGAEHITVFEKVYAHVLADADAMVEWVRGTALRAYLELVADERQELFVKRYRDKVRAAFPGSPVFYPFRRTLFAATRPI